VHRRAERQAGYPSGADLGDNLAYPVTYGGEDRFRRLHGEAR
jgi:hypothetical protein